MVVINRSMNEKRIELERFRGMLGSARSGHNVLTNEPTSLVSGLQIPAQTALILELGS